MFSDTLIIGSVISIGHFGIGTDILLNYTTDIVISVLIMSLYIARSITLIITIEEMLVFI